MAGESPDKSEQQESSGAATTSRERDPRLSVFRASSGSSGDQPEERGTGAADDATTPASTVSTVARGEAAPVAGEEADEADTEAATDAAADPDGDTGTGTDTGSDDAGGSSDADGSPEAEPDAGSVDAEPRPRVRGAGAGEEGPGVRPAQADAPEGEDRETPPAGADPPSRAARDAGSAAGRSATGGSGVQLRRAGEGGAKSVGDPRRVADAAPADGPATDGTGAETPEVGGRGPSEAAEEDWFARPGRAKPALADDAGAKGDRPESDRTAVLRTTPKRPSVDETTVLRTVRPGPAEPAVDEPTAVFKLPKPPGEAKPDAAETTAVFRAPTPPAVPKESTFVPLREEGSGAAPKSAAPAATPRPAAAAGTAQEGPATGRPAAALDGTERTRQQPLPPRPPLDMLAELTNNPPPPPSALRTTARRIKIWTPLVALLAIVFVVVQMVRPLPAPTLTMTGDSSYVFAGEKPELSDPVMGQSYVAATGLGMVDSYGEQKPVPIASVTKAMTAYVILRDHPFKRGQKGAMIEVDKTAETEGQFDKTDKESTLNTVKEGDRISEYDAIAALMIPSANNIARLLARWDSGSQEAFVKKMNDTAKELGMTNTTYTDPSGLDATTVSTAEDQVKLGLELVEIPVLRDITRMQRWTDPSGTRWDNWNTLTADPTVLGIKTGSTTKAGGNLLFAAHKMIGDTDQFVVGAVLAQHSVPILGSAIAASKKMLDEAKDNLTGAKAVKKGDVVGFVDDGLGTRVPVVATEDVEVVGWPSLKVDIELKGNGAALPHTAGAGTEVGVLTVGEGTSQVKVPVALQADLLEPSFGSKLTRIA
ncbi:D-alanyl-D-alanine carboxypeptidase [Streptomyces sp. NPDC006879]|uniref:D-alanyl-D-alanine carboxypeptidase n=1 Tax=Streptomyces sp. NPDC006879 TaxID=3364767 RepID=UPI0036951973